MIVSGIDLIEINRIRKSIENPRFIARVFSDAEQAWLLHPDHGAEHLAACFAAKEAFAKAIGKGVRGYSLNEVEVAHDLLGCPQYVFHGKAAEIVRKMQLQLSLSITHVEEYACAIVHGTGEPMYQTVIFDLDGTLLDTSPGVLVCLEYAVRNMKLPPLSHEQALSFIGPPLYQTFARVCSLTPEEVERAVGFFREKYRGGEQFNAKVFDGIVDVIDYARAGGRKTAVATLKYHKFAMSVLEHFGLDKHFDVICGSDEKSELTKAELIQKVLETTETAPEKAVLIGDSKYDAIGARDAGIDFIAVEYGFSSPGEFDPYPNVAICKTTKEIAYYI